MHLEYLLPLSFVSSSNQSDRKEQLPGFQVLVFFGRASAKYFAYRRFHAEPYNIAV